MNVKIVKEWISELKKFTKESNARQLRFPMFMESSIGDLLSPEGILCNMHAKATGGKWLPEPHKDKVLRGYTSYDGQTQIAPDSVLKWVGLTPGLMSVIRTSNGEGGFEAVVKHLEQLLRPE